MDSKKNHRYYLCHRKKNLAFIKCVVELQGKPLRHGGLEIKGPTYHPFKVKMISVRYPSEKVFSNGKVCSGRENQQAARKI